MRKQKYGIGTQDFETLIERGFVYVDKTPLLAELLDGSDFYFLSRPRRFGKTLFLSTLENFFMAKRNLFKGLYIDSYPWKWEEYPVIRIDMTGENYKVRGNLERKLDRVFQIFEQTYNISSADDSMSGRFETIIRKAYEITGKKVVILIDEYEKPLLDAFENKELLARQADLLSAVYSVIKLQDSYLRFVFITGITRFGHLNIFSGLNNIRDISLDDKFASICGLTQNEIEDYLHLGIEDFAANHNMSYDKALELLKNYYDGYHFSGSLIDIYNPYSVLNCLESKRITANWFITGSPSFLLNVLKKSHFNLSNLEESHISETDLLGADSSMKDDITLLYQSGYLTIKAYDPDGSYYTLGVPNNEVKQALYETIIPFYMGAERKVSGLEVKTVADYLLEGQPGKAMLWLKSFFGGIPYSVRLNFEKDFQFLLVCFFSLLGMRELLTVEKQTANGRIDMVIQTPKFVYVFEFKRGDSAQSAIEQINSKDYTLPWVSLDRKVFKIGVAFSPSIRGISDFIIQ